VYLPQEYCFNKTEKEQISFTLLEVLVKDQDKVASLAQPKILSEEPPQKTLMHNLEIKDLMSHWLLQPEKAETKVR
jgi:hypothetical protein